MARGEVFRLKSGNGLVIDCQADILHALPSRFVVPLVPEGELRQVTRRLHPIFSIDGSSYVMLTHAAASIAATSLGNRVADLQEQEHLILNALDVLISGV